MSKENNLNKKSLAVALGSVFLASSIVPLASAESTNPFQAESLQHGYEEVNYGSKAPKGEEGKCGEGKCGDKKKGEGKCGEGKCGDKKKGEGKCGEGKCGH